MWLARRGKELGWTAKCNFTIIRRTCPEIVLTIWKKEDPLNEVLYINASYVQDD